MPQHQICLSTTTFPPAQGGVAVAAARLARYLHEAGYGVHVVTSLTRPGAAGEVTTSDDHGVHVHRLIGDSAISSESLFAIRQQLHRLDAEVGFSLFHGFFLTAAHPCVVVAERAGRSRPRPVIASIRGNDVATLLDQPAARVILLPVLRKATWLTSVNAAYLARVAEEVNVAGRSSVIRNGVAPRPGSHDAWRVTDFNRGIVGTIGVFRKVKDIPLLVRAYAGLPATVRRRLVLAGFFDDDEEEQWTETLIDEFGLRDEVEITGRFPHADVDTHLRRLHVYVQSSGSEGLPNALLEAACAGVPLVATAVGGMQEVLTDGVSALLVPHGEPRKMSDAIERVLGDEPLAARLSAGAHSLAGELSPARERAEWLALYERLLS